ncbi:MAG TPA: transporter [Sphingomicrobium sp.]|nr:transporter [Sphingomicrobium sp.]
MRGGWRICAAAALYVSSAARAEEAPICADRPGKATSTCTVPKGHWQIETGLADWTLDKTSAERDTSLVIGETMIKYGLTSRSDIAVDISPWQRFESRTGGVHDRSSGFGDVTILYKQKLSLPDAPLEVDLLPFVKVPTAGHSLGNGKWEGGLMVPVGYSIPGTALAIGLTPELDFVADLDGNGHHGAMAQVASLGWSVSDRLSLSAEIWGAWDWDPSGTTRQASVDGSIAFLASHDVQLDAGANLGLNRNTPDVELYGGVSFRF